MSLAKQLVDTLLEADKPWKVVNQDPWTVQFDTYRAAEDFIEDLKADSYVEDTSFSYDYGEMSGVHDPGPDFDVQGAGELPDVIILPQQEVEDTVGDVEILTFTCKSGIDAGEFAKDPKATAAYKVTSKEGGLVTATFDVNQSKMEAPHVQNKSREWITRR